MTISGTRPGEAPAATLANAEGTKAGVTSGGTPMRIGSVALTVRDLATVSRFYQEIIGLAPIETGTGVARLGVGETVLLELREDASAPLASPRAAGLFHTAFLLPQRTDLAQWLLQASEQSVRIQGASDHLVSEAIYLADPEGNGIEVYWDRPSEIWTERDGMIQMATLRLDLQELVGAVAVRDWQGVPEGSRIGHVHLQVGALDPAEGFYSKLLGFDMACRYRGATFLGSGGYHHHIGTNIWNSAGAPVRKEPTTGLADVEIVADAAMFSAIRARLPSDEGEISDPGRLTLRDPWGTAVTVVAG